MSSIRKMVLLRGVQFNRCLQLSGVSRNFTLSGFSAEKSDIHTDNLYQGSSTDDRFKIPQAYSVRPSKEEDFSHIQNPSQSAKSLFNGHIPMKELTVKQMLASGPGGQNVNKVPTKIEMRFELNSASWLSEEAKKILNEKLGSQLTKEGWLIVKSDRTRSQSLNRADALRKLREVLWVALEPETPKIDEEEEERIRKGKLKAARQRLQFKRDRRDKANFLKGE